MDRRDFIKKSALGTAVITSPFYIGSFAINRKLKVGLIGAGWYGMVISKAALKVGGLEIVAVCDVDSEHLQKSAEELENLQGTRPRTYKYYHPGSSRFAGLGRVVRPRPKAGLQAEYRAF